jgi:hypothetical protein
MPSGISKNNVSIVASHKTFGYPLVIANCLILKPTFIEFYNEGGFAFIAPDYNNYQYSKFLYNNIPITIIGANLKFVKRVTIGEVNASIQRVNYYTDTLDSMVVIVPPPPAITDQVNIKVIDYDDVIINTIPTTYIREPIIESVSATIGPSGSIVYVTGKYLDRLETLPTTSSPQSTLTQQFYTVGNTYDDCYLYPDYEQGGTTEIKQFSNFTIQNNALAVTMKKGQVITQNTTDQITLYRKFGSNIVATASFPFTFTPTPVITQVIPSSTVYGVLVKAIGNNLKNIKKNGNSYVVSDTIMYINTTYLNTNPIVYDAAPIPFPFTPLTTFGYGYEFNRITNIVLSGIIGRISGDSYIYAAAGETVVINFDDYTNINGIANVIIDKIFLKSNFIFFECFKLINRDIACFISSNS